MVNVPHPELGLGFVPAPVKDGGGMTCREESAHDMRADEPGTANKDNVHARLAIAAGFGLLAYMEFHSSGRKR